MRRAFGEIVTYVEKVKTMKYKIETIFADWKGEFEIPEGAIFVRERWSENIDYENPNHIKNKPFKHEIEILVPCK